MRHRSQMSRKTLAEIKTQEKSVESSSLTTSDDSITISIYVIITGVSQSVLICVALVWILHKHAVITSIAMQIFVAVLLVYVRCQPTVVL